MGSDADGVPGGPIHLVIGNAGGLGAQPQRQQQQGERPAGSWDAVERMRASGQGTPRTPCVKFAGAMLSLNVEFVPKHIWKLIRLW